MTRVWIFAFVLCMFSGFQDVSCTNECAKFGSKGAFILRCCCDYFCNCDSNIISSFPPSPDDISAFPEKIYKEDIRTIQLEHMEMEKNFINKTNLHMYPNVQTIVIKRSKLTKLGANAFMNPGTANTIKTLEITDNSIKEIDKDAFSGLSHLQKLDLSRNGLSDLPLEIFNHNTKLETIRFEGNRLVKIRKGWVLELPHLKELYLSSNSITTFDGFIHRGLLKLSLRNNSISDLRSGVFSELTNLSDIDLSENRIESLPPDIFNGNDFFSIDLCRNQIKSLDRGIFWQLCDLHSLYLEENQLTIVHYEWYANIAFKRTTPTRKKPMLKGNPLKCAGSEKDIQSYSFFLENVCKDNGKNKEKVNYLNIKCNDTGKYLIDRSKCKSSIHIDESLKSKIQGNNLEGNFAKNANRPPLLNPFLSPKCAKVPFDPPTALPITAPQTDYKTLMIFCMIGGFILIVLMLVVYGYFRRRTTTRHNSKNSSIESVNYQLSPDQDSLSYMFSNSSPEPVSNLLIDSKPLLSQLYNRLYEAEAHHQSRINPSTMPLVFTETVAPNIGSHSDQNIDLDGLDRSNQLTNRTRAMIHQQPEQPIPGLDTNTANSQNQSSNQTVSTVVLSNRPPEQPISGPDTNTTYSRNQSSNQTNSTVVFPSFSSAPSSIVPLSLLENGNPSPNGTHVQHGEVNYYSNIAIGDNSETRKSQGNNDLIRLCPNCSNGTAEKHLSPNDPPVQHGNHYGHIDTEYDSRTGDHQGRTGHISNGLYPNCANGTAECRLSPNGTGVQHGEEKYHSHTSPGNHSVSTGHTESNNCPNAASDYINGPHDVGGCRDNFPSDPSSTLISCSTLPESDQFGSVSTGIDSGFGSVTRPKEVVSSAQNSRDSDNTIPKELASDSNQHIESLGHETNPRSRNTYVSHSEIISISAASTDPSCPPMHPPCGAQVDPAYTPMHPPDVAPVDPFHTASDLMVPPRVLMRHPQAQGPPIPPRRGPVVPIYESDHNTTHQTTFDPVPPDSDTPSSRQYYSIPNPAIRPQNEPHVDPHAAYNQEQTQSEAIGQIVGGNTPANSSLSHVILCPTCHQVPSGTYIQPENSAIQRNPSLYYHNPQVARPPLSNQLPPSRNLEDSATQRIPPLNNPQLQAAPRPSPNHLPPPTSLQHQNSAILRNPQQNYLQLEAAPHLVQLPPASRRVQHVYQDEIPVALPTPGPLNPDCRLRWHDQQHVPDVVYHDTCPAKTSPPKS